MTVKRNRDPVLRSFLRAAAIAFALGADSIPALADDEMPEPPVNTSADMRGSAGKALQEAHALGQAVTASLTLIPQWRGVPDPVARLRLLDAGGHKLLQSPVHGRCSFSGLPAGTCTLLLKTAGHTSIHRVELASGRATVVEVVLDA